MVDAFFIYFTVYRLTRTQTPDTDMHDNLNDQCFTAFEEAVTSYTDKAMLSWRVLFIYIYIFFNHRSLTYFTHWPIARQSKYTLTAEAMTLIFQCIAPAGSVHMDYASLRMVEAIVLAESSRSPSNRPSYLTGRLAGI